MKRAMQIIAVLVSILFTVSAMAQGNITLKGIVSDQAGEPIPGVSVLVKGNNSLYATTDEAGHFSLNTPSNATVQFICVGFVTKEENVSGRKEINVVLEQDTQLLEETIVVAYGTSTKTSFTGSISVVNSDAIKDRAVTNVANALAGTTAGVQIINSNGDPTSNAPTIRIRGVGSMYSSNNPLYVVDGVPYDGSISDINPNDVESISVLKDAAANTLYGARGANGVVIITTKKAESRDGKVSLEARWGSNSRLIPQYDVITDPAQYYETHYKMMYNSQYYAGKSIADSYAFADANIFNQANGGLGYQVYTVPAGERFIGYNFKLNPNATLGYSNGTNYYIPDDWYNETFHNSFRQEYNASFSGATGRLNYYASVGYLDDGGIVANSNYKRYTARLNAEYQIKKWLKLATSMNYAHGDAQKASYSSTYGSSGNVFYVTNMMGPIYPLYVRDASGNILYENGYPVFDANQTAFKRPGVVGNAVRDNLINTNRYTKDDFNGKLGIVATPVKGLTLTGNIGVNSSNSRQNILYSRFASGSSDDGMVEATADRFFSVDIQALADYKISFGKNNLNAMVGFDQYRYEDQEILGFNDHLFSPTIDELNNALGTDKKRSESYTNRYMHMGWFTRLQYDYDEKIFLSASFRRDASSRLSPKNRWGNFYSASAAYVISKESFFKDVNWVDLLKIKASYGMMGNDNLGRYYPYADSYEATYNKETGEYGLNLVWKGNEDLGWEKSNTFNTGIEFELFGGKLNGSLEYFSRATADMLYYKDVPLSSGNPIGYYPVNVGSVRNNGVELSLDGNIINKKQVSWDWNINLSNYKNVITSLDESVSGEGIKNSNSIYKVGGSLYEAYLYKYAGVNPETGKAQYYKEGKDGSVSITEVFDQATKFDCGDILPKLFGGFGTSVKFYGFDLSLQLSFQLGGRYYDGTYQALMHTQSSAGNAWHKDALKAWTPDNTNTDVPRLDGDSSVGQSPVDRFLVSSNYLSVNNLTLGYTLPEKLVSKIGISNLRVYVTGDNLAVLTARKGIDPRYNYGIGGYTSGSGLNSGSYSAMRTITAGVSLKF